MCVRSMMACWHARIKERKKRPGDDRRQLMALMLGDLSKEGAWGVGTCQIQVFLHQPCVLDK